LWRETRIGNILPWDEIADEEERLLEIDQANQQVPDAHHVDKVQEDDQVVDRDETDPYNEVTLGRRRPDSIAFDWTSKGLYVLEFKHTSHQRQNYRECGESRGRAQHGVLVKSLEKVAGEADGENGGWKIKLIVFVGGTVDQCTHKHSTIISRNLGLSSRKETQSGKDSCTSCFMHKTRSCSHTSHKDLVRGVRVVAEKVRWKKLSKGWTVLNEIWRETVGRKMGQVGRLRAESTSEQVDVGMLEQEGKSRVWQP
jgi:hypothetical protein